MCPANSGNEFAEFAGYDYLRRELAEATARAKRSDIARHVAGGEALMCCPGWGLDLVIPGAEFYEPCPSGDLAFIVGAFKGGELIDLIATSESFGLRARRGEARVLGDDHLQDALWSRRTALKLYETALSWLRNGRDGTVILDWRHAPFMLEGVAAIVCETPLLAGRIRTAFARAMTPPPLFVRSSTPEASDAS